jgi:hypothetical protein
MISKTLIATAIAATLGAGSALAHTGPVLSGGSDDMSIGYPGAPGTSLVGGGDVRLSGGGDDQTANYARTMTGEAGPIGMLVGGSDDAVIVYKPGAASALAMASGAAQR